MKAPGSRLTFQEAVGALPDRDFVHVVSNEIGSVFVMSEGSKAREWVTDILIRAELMVADESFQRMGHGLQAKIPGKTYFFESQEHASPESAYAYADAMSVAKEVDA